MMLLLHSEIKYLSLEKEYGSVSIALIPQFMDLKEEYCFFLSAAWDWLDDMDPDSHIESVIYLVRYRQFS